jgi:hypothetical protein
MFGVTETFGQVHKLCFFNNTEQTILQNCSIEYVELYAETRRKEKFPFRGGGFLSIYWTVLVYIILLGYLILKTGQLGLEKVLFILDYTFILLYIPFMRHFSFSFFFPFIVLY